MMVPSSKRMNVQRATARGRRKSKSTPKAPGVCKKCSYQSQLVYVYNQVRQKLHFKGDIAKFQTLSSVTHCLMKGFCIHACTLYILNCSKAISGLDWDCISERTFAMSTGANNMWMAQLILHLQGFLHMFKTLFMSWWTFNLKDRKKTFHRAQLLEKTLQEWLMLSSVTLVRS